MLKKKLGWNSQNNRKEIKSMEKVLPFLSYYGRVLVANNLVALLLWQRAIFMQPRETLLRTVQGKLLGFYSACAVYDCTEFEMSPVSTTSPASPPPPPRASRQPMTAVR